MAATVYRVNVQTKTGLHIFVYGESIFTYFI